MFCGLCDVGRKVLLLRLRWEGTLENGPALGTVEEPLWIGVPDGAARIDGRLEGPSVGRKLGGEVGRLLGCVVGWRDGELEGIVEGFAVGICVVGTSEGCSEGALVGEAVNDGDAVYVGVADGIRVKYKAGIDGGRVGEREGAEVCCTEGAKVGGGEGIEVGC